MKKYFKYKIYRLKWFLAGFGIKFKSPLHVDIELTNCCNFKCKMCAHSYSDFIRGVMNIDLAKKIIDDCVKNGVYGIKFNWRGEATLSSNLPELIKYAKDRGVLDIQLNTNGSMRKELIRCVDAGIDKIIFSLDGFSKETYEKIRIGGNFEEVSKTINMVRDWIDIYEYKTKLKVQMVKTNINKHEVNDFLEYYKKIGIETRVSNVTDRGQGDILSFDKKIERKFCSQPFKRLTIGFDGKIHPCCVDWNNNYVLGNIKETSIKNVWSSIKINYLRTMISNNNFKDIPLCDNCFSSESFK